MFVLSDGSGFKFMFQGCLSGLSFMFPRAPNQKNEPQETKYCMPNLLYTCNVRRGMQYWFLVGSYLQTRARRRYDTQYQVPQESTSWYWGLGHAIPRVSFLRYRYCMSFFFTWFFLVGFARAY